MNRGSGRLFRRGNSPYWWVAYYAFGVEFRESSRATNYGDARIYLDTRLSRIRNSPDPTLNRLVKPGVVYFVRNKRKQLVKIGFSEKPGERLKVMDWAAPGDFSIVALLPGTKETESALHKCFESCRSSHEWFTIKEPLSSFLDALQKSSGRTRISRQEKEIIQQTRTFIASFADTESSNGTDEQTVSA